MRVIRVDEKIDCHKKTCHQCKYASLFQGLSWDIIICLKYHIELEETGSDFLRCQACLDAEVK